jgi:RNA polymerase sigma-70 factor, ECF subfamily
MTEQPGPERPGAVTEGLPQPRPEPAGVGESDAALLAALRRRDPDTFAQVVDAWSPMMLRVARSHVSTDASAEEVVQDAWLGVIRGLDRFEGRSSLRTWVFRILVNTAKTRGVREARTVPWSSLGPEDDEQGPTVDPDRFRGPDDPYPRHWTPEGAPRPWAGPEGAVLAAEVRKLLAEALDVLPPRQRSVVSLRDVHGLDADEVCDLLNLTQANQRVLLHRGRARVRAALEDYYRDSPSMARS